jgi:hypothetical protein
MDDGSLWGNGAGGSNGKGGLEVGDRVGVAVDVEEGSVRWFRNGQLYHRHPAKVTGPVTLGVQMYLGRQMCTLIANPDLPEGL